MRSDLNGESVNGKLWCHRNGVWKTVYGWIFLEKGQIQLLNYLIPSYKVIFFRKLFIVGIPIFIILKAIKTTECA